jgi:putative spermidine/putrescine transport system substrate-binding protein
MKKTLAILIALLLLVAGCARNEPQTPQEPADFAQALETARGTTVTFYGWGGDQSVNSWIDNVLAVGLKENYDVTLRRVPMNIDEILNKLMGEKEAGVASGDIDVVWINGENFYTAKNAGLLYGPFADMLENYGRYLNPNDPDIHFDFGTPIEGMSVPYGKAQLVFIGDTAVLDSFPTSAEELLEMARQNPGRLTYPAPPHFVGSAFVRNIIYEIVGFDALFNAPSDENAILEVIRPALDFLVELKPYLWQAGATYPSDNIALDMMFVDGLSLMTMNYTPLYAAQRIAAGEFPQTAQTFVFDKGNIGNTHYVAIPFNAPNKAGAMALINHIISPEMQTTKYDVNNWGDLPVFDASRLSSEQRAVLDSIDNGIGILTPAQLQAHRVAEVQASKIPIIDRLWQRHILG